MRAVVTTPVDIPRSSARSMIVLTLFVRVASAQNSLRAMLWSTEMAPSLVLMPATMAVAVGAESEVCWFALAVTDKARSLNLSKLSRFHSPSTPRCWPSRMRAAVTVDTPMPSPTKRITFFARRVFSSRLTSLFASTADLPALNHSAPEVGTGEAEALSASAGAAAPPSTVRLAATTSEIRDFDFMCGSPLPSAVGEVWRGPEH